MPKLDLRNATRIKVAGGELAALKGAGFDWVKPATGARWVVSALGDSLVPGRANFHADRVLLDDPIPTNAAQFVNNAFAGAGFPFEQIVEVGGPIWFPDGADGVGRISPIERMMIDYQALAGGRVGVIPLATGGSSLQVGWNASTGNILAARTASHNLAMSRFEAFDGIAPVVGAVVINLGSNDNADVATLRGWMEGLIAHIRANFDGVTETTPVLLCGPAKAGVTLGDNYRNLYAEIASEQDHVFLVHPPYPTVAADNLHPTLAEGRTWGVNLAVKARQALTGTEPIPEWEIDPSQPVQQGTTIAIDLTHAGLSLPSPYGVPVITGGADAALFEIAGTLFAPTLRWASNGTGPAAGSYAVQVSLRNNAGQVGNPLNLTVQVQAEVSPAQFFEAGDRGYVVDLNDLSTLWQDREGTIPVTAAGQPVGRILDKSPNAWVLQAPANNTTRPTYVLDANGNGQLEFAGAQYLRSDNPVMEPGVRGDAAQWTCAAAVEYAAQTGDRETFADGGNTTADFVNYLQIQAGDDFRAWGRFAGTNFPIATVTANILTGTRTPFVLASQYDGTFTGPGVFRPLRARVASTTPNWTQANGGPTTQVSGNTKFILGANFITAINNPITGRIGSFYIIDRVLSDTNRAACEAWVAARSVADLAV